MPRIAITNPRYQRLLELIMILVILGIAVFFGFWKPTEYTHPLHGDLVITGNGLYNIHNRIPYEVDGELQWIHERVHYFYTAPLYYAYAALFWNNAKDYADNFVFSTMLCLVVSFILSYLFMRRFFGRAVAITGLLLMSLSTDWYYYIIRMLYGPWALLPAVAVAIYWLYFKFIETDKLRFMVAAGFVAGLSFYFVPWPLLVITVPALGVCVFLVSSPERKIERRFFGWAVMLLVVAGIIALKEFIFSITGLRYKDDPSGITCFYDIFFRDRYNTMGNFGKNFDQSNTSYWIRAVKGGISRFYERVLQFRFSGGLLTPLVLAAFYGGLVHCFRKEGFAGRFVAVNTVVTLSVLYLLIDAQSRYSLSVYPLAYLIAGCFLVRIYEKIYSHKRRLVLFAVALAAGLAVNINDLVNVYMAKTLRSYSTFEANCYNSIEWPLPALKKFLQERKTVYDLIVLPRTLNHHQMHMYLRWYPGTVRLDGQSYGRSLIHDDDFRERMKDPNVRAEIPRLKILVVTNNYNNLMEGCDGCGPSGVRLPYDPDTMTVAEAQQFIPGLHVVGYAGFKDFPQMYTLLELNSNWTPLPQFDVKRYRSAAKLVATGGYHHDERKKINEENLFNAVNLFDGKATTLWRVPVVENEHPWASYHFDRPTRLKQIDILNPKRIEEAPTALRLEASSDGKNWEKIGEGAMPPPAAEDIKTVRLQMNKFYQDYRITFSTPRGQEVLAVADVLLLGDQR